MAKIIKIDGETVSIGTDDGKIKEVQTSELNFNPSVGDEVEVFESNDSIIVSKKSSSSQENDNNGININVNNSSNFSNGKQSKKVNKIAYCLIAFFLGGIGVHKFYAEKIGLGILYLLFCWTAIPAVIAFVEFIIAICKEADADGNILV